MDIFYTKNKENSGEYARKILKERYGVRAPHLETGEFGKPYLTNAPYFFSISHTKTLLAVAVSHTEVGLDVEDTTRSIPKSIRNRLTKQEQNEDFFAVWTAKEAYIKYLGETLARRYAALEYYENTLFNNKKAISVVINHIFAEDYLFCTCQKQGAADENVTMICTDET